MNLKYTDNRNISLTDSLSRSNPQEPSTKMTQDTLLNVSESMQSPLGATLAVDNSQKTLKDLQRTGMESIGFTPTSNFAFVPMTFASYPNYVPNTVYGYSQNGTSSYPMYSYNPQLTERDRDAWASSKIFFIKVDNFTPARMPMSYVPVSQPFISQHVNAGILANGMLSGNMAPSFQNSVAQVAPNTPFIPHHFVYQNANAPTIKSLNDMRKNFQATNISGPLLGQEPQNSQHGLNNLVPNGLSQGLRPEGVNVTTPEAHINVVKNELLSAPFVAVAQNKGEIPAMILQNDVAISNRIPLMVPAVLAHFPADNIPNRIQNGITANHMNGVPQKLVPAFMGKPPIYDPQSVSNTADATNFLNVQNDVIFDPLTQTPLLWNSLTRTPLVMNSAKDEMSLPRDIQPSHFLNVYPITGVPMPTLIAATTVAGKTKKTNTEDIVKNKKYAVSQSLLMS